MGLRAGYLNGVVARWAAWATFGRRPARYYLLLCADFDYLFTDPLMQEDARDNLVTSEKKVRELEARLQDEQLVSANNQKVPNSVHGGLK